MTVAEAASSVCLHLRGRSCTRVRVCLYSVKLHTASGLLFFFFALAFSACLSAANWTVTGNRTDSAHHFRVFFGFLSTGKEAAFPQKVHDGAV